MVTFSIQILLADCRYSGRKKKIHSALLLMHLPGRGRIETFPACLFHNVRSRFIPPITNIEAHFRIGSPVPPSLV